MKEKVYAEIGIGNETFLSTEIEKGSKEIRLPRFVIPKKIEQIYLRLWILKRVLIISSQEGIKIKSKDKDKFKILFGIGGTK